MPNIEAINRYPFKSASANHLESAVISRTGLQYDRHWMIADAQTGELVSQRKGHGRLARIDVELESDAGRLRLRAPDAPPLDISLAATDKGIRRYVTVHGNQCEAIDEGDAAAKWITDYLAAENGRPLRIVHFPSDAVRALDRHFARHDTLGTEYADGFPVLVVAAEELEELNRRIAQAGKEPVPMSRFRPNLVLRGLDWDELDHVDKVRIDGGRVELQLVKPCGRCEVTTIDQTTGERGSNREEPLATLATYRRGSQIADRFPELRKEDLSKVYFAHNAVIVTGVDETIAVGADVEVTRKQ